MICVSPLEGELICVSLIAGSGTQKGDRMETGSKVTPKPDPWAQLRGPLRDCGGLPFHSPVDLRERRVVVLVCNM